MAKQLISLALITALAPKGHQFSAEDVTPEGIWMTNEHLQNVEAALGKNDQSIEMTALQAKLDAAVAEKATLQTQLDTANATISKQTTTIDAQKAEIAELGAQGSGNGTENPIAADPKKSDDPMAAVNAPFDAVLAERLGY